MRCQGSARAVLAAGVLVLPLLVFGQEQPVPPPAQEPAPVPPPAPAPPPAPPRPAAQPPQVPSKPPPKPVAFLLEVGGDHGTNELYRLVYTNDTMSVGANTGIFLQVGAAFLPLAEGRVRTHATIGIKWTGQEASNGSVDYASFPLEVIETVDLAPIRLGGGLYALLSPTLKGKGVAAPITTNFRNSLGFTLRAEYRWAKVVGLGLRYVWNRLEARGGGSLEAPALGFVLSVENTY